MTFVFGVIKDAKELIQTMIYSFVVVVQALILIRYVILVKIEKTRSKRKLKRNREWPPKTDEDCYLEIKKGFNLEKNGLTIAALFAYFTLILIWIGCSVILYIKYLLGG